MKKNLLFTMMIFVSSMYGFQRVGRAIGNVKNALFQGRQAQHVVKSTRNFSLRPSSPDKKIKTFVTDFSCRQNPAANFVSSGIAPVIKGSFLTNVRDLATQLWHKFGMVERYFFPVLGARVLQKDRAFATAAKEVIHSIIETEHQYRTELQSATDGVSKMGVIEKELDLLSRSYDNYASQICSFPYSEISYLKIVLYHVYTAKLLYQMKRDILLIKDKTDSIFELEQEMQGLLKKINTELVRLQEFFDSKYQKEKKFHDEGVSAGLGLTKKEPERIVVFSDTVDYVSQFDESSILDYFMEKLFNTHDRTVVSLVVKNTIWFDREQNDYHERIKETKDPIEKIKISIEKLRRLDNEDHLMDQRRRGHDDQVFAMIDDAFCREDRDKWGKSLRANVESFREKYSEKMAKESQKLYSFYEQRCKTELGVKERIIASLQAEIVQLRDERRKLLDASTQLQQEPYLDLRYCEKLINSVMYQNTLKLLEQLEMIAK